MTRADDHTYLNLPGQAFRLYVGFGDEIRIAVDAAMPSPAPTVWAGPRGFVPYRPTVCLGPHRIAFVNEPIPFYGGYSYSRWRIAAFDHQWSVQGPASATVSTGPDETITYRDGSGESATALIVFPAPGIYTVSCTVSGSGSNEIPIGTHTGRRQVIVYPSRSSAFAGVVSVGAISGSVEQGGFSTQLSVKGDISFLLSPRSLDGYIPVVIMAEYYYETSYGAWERKEIGPNWQSAPLGGYRDDPRLIFSGYVNSESVAISADQTTATFDCRTADLILEQMQSATWGFFESAYDGAGITFNDLMTHDVIRHMLQEHANFTEWHDTRLHYNMRDWPYPGGLMQGMEYRDWTWQQGMYWSNIRDTADNQFEQAFVDNRSSLVVMPDRNMWPPDTNRRPEEDSSAEKAIFVHRYMEHRPISVVAAGAMVGEAAWIAPLEIRVHSRMSQAISYYKIIGTLSYSNEEWGADYPKDRPRPASGKWVLVQGKYYSDDERQANWERMWRFAARGFAAANLRFHLEVRFGMHHYWRLGDIVEVIYADPKLNLSFQRTSGVSSGTNGNWFEVISIQYDINVEGATWGTVYMLRELTTYNAPSPDIPSVPDPPKKDKD